MKFVSAKVRPTPKQWVVTPIHACRCNTDSCNWVTMWSRSPTGVAQESHSLPCGVKEWPTITGSQMNQSGHNVRDPGLTTLPSHSLVKPAFELPALVTGGSPTHPNCSLVTLSASCARASCLPSYEMCHLSSRTSFRHCSCSKVMEGGREGGREGGIVKCFQLPNSHHNPL